MGGLYGFDGFQASNMGFFLSSSEEGEQSDRPSDGESGGEESNDEPMDEERWLFAGESGDHRNMVILAMENADVKTWGWKIGKSTKIG